MKPQQRGQRHDRDMTLQDQVLICPAREKRFRLKELGNVTTGFLLRPDTSPPQESLTFPVYSTDSPLSVKTAAEGYWILVLSQMQRFFCEQSQREKELKREWTPEDKRDGSTYRWRWQHVSILCCGQWQSGRSSFSSV